MPPNGGGKRRRTITRLARSQIGEAPLITPAAARLQRGNGPPPQNSHNSLTRRPPEGPRRGACFDRERNPAWHAAGRRSHGRSSSHREANPCRTHAAALAVHTPYP